MKIGEMSKITGLSIDTIRFYEKEGLIKKPSRSESGYRDYDAQAKFVVEFIAHCRSLDIPLAEIRKLLRVRSGAAKSCREANEVIEEQLLNLRKRIRELKRLEKSLSSIRSVCVREIDAKDCQIIKSLQNLN